MSLRLAARVGHVDHRAPAQLALDADRVVQRLRRRRIMLEPGHAARRLVEGRLRLGGLHQRDGGVAQHRVVLRGWLPPQDVEPVGVDEPVVVAPEARVQRRLAVARDVPRDADAALGLDALAHAEADAVGRPLVVGHHAVVGVAGVRHERADVHLRLELAGHGILRQVLTLFTLHRPVEQRGSSRDVPIGIPRRGARALPGRRPRTEPEESHAVVNRQRPADLPRVLPVELDRGPAALHVGEAVGFGVGC